MFCSATPALRNCAGNVRDELVEHPEAEIAGDQHDARIPRRLRAERGNKRVSHSSGPSSASARVELLALRRDAVVPEHAVLHEAERAWPFVVCAITHGGWSVSRVSSAAAVERSVIVAVGLATAQPKARHLSANGSSASVSSTGARLWILL